VSRDTRELLPLPYALTTLRQSRRRVSPCLRGGRPGGWGLCEAGNWGGWSLQNKEIGSPTLAVRRVMRNLRGCRQRSSQWRQIDRSSAPRSRSAQSTPVPRRKPPSCVSRRRDGWRMRSSRSSLKLRKTLAPTRTLCASLRGWREVSLTNSSRDPHHRLTWRPAAVEEAAPHRSPEPVS
jgi:hypothetical protein